MADSERIGPYRVIRRLGAGGMGEVVLAHDDRLDRPVAIKRLHDDAATPDRRERFRREARIAARLDHPAIVRIHDVLHEGDHDYLILEYVEGETLRARRDAGPMTVSEVLGIAHQITLGMAAAHDLGIIHRDLKAETVLITRAGRAKLTDFGIAKLDSDDTVTAKGAVVGTFRAMSPEQALGHPLDHRSDLFSFGILLYEALAGESPFRARPVDPRRPREPGPPAPGQGATAATARLPRGRHGADRPRRPGVRRAMPRRGAAGRSAAIRRRRPAHRGQCRASWLDNRCWRAATLAGFGDHTRGSASPVVGRRAECCRSRRPGPRLRATRRPLRWRRRGYADRPRGRTAPRCPGRQRPPRRRAARHRRAQRRHGWRPGARRSRPRSLG
jgi:hypothetical protein